MKGRIRIFWCNYFFLLRVFPTTKQSHENFIRAVCPEHLRNDFSTLFEYSNKQYNNCRTWFKQRTAYFAREFLENTEAGKAWTLARKRADEYHDEAPGEFAGASATEAQLEGPQKVLDLFNFMDKPGIQFTSYHMIEFYKKYLLMVEQEEEVPAGSNLVSWMAHDDDDYWRGNLFTVALTAILKYVQIEGRTPGGTKQSGFTAIMDNIDFDWRERVEKDLMFQFNPNISPDEAFADNISYSTYKPHVVGEFVAPEHQKYTDLALASKPVPANATEMEVDDNDWFSGIGDDDFHQTEAASQHVGSQHVASHFVLPQNASQVGPTPATSFSPSQFATPERFKAVKSIPLPPPGDGSVERPFTFIRAVPDVVSSPPRPLAEIMGGYMEHDDNFYNQDLVAAVADASNKSNEEPSKFLKEQLDSAGVRHDKKMLKLTNIICPPSRDPASTHIANLWTNSNIYGQTALMISQIKQRHSYLMAVSFNIQNEIEGLKKLKVQLENDEKELQRMIDFQEYMNSNLDDEKKAIEGQKERINEMRKNVAWIQDADKVGASGAFESPIDLTQNLSTMSNSPSEGTRGRVNSRFNAYNTKKHLEEKRKAEGVQVGAANVSDNGGKTGNDSDGKPPGENTPGANPFDGKSFGENSQLADHGVGKGSSVTENE